MKFRRLDGCEVILDLRQSRWPQRSIEDCKSKLQFGVGEELRKIFPRFVILEEFAIPGEHLFLDFFIPQLLIAVEADGSQHDTYVPFFHGSRLGFERAMLRDKKKYRWCELNNIVLYRYKRPEDVRKDFC